MDREPEPDWREKLRSAVADSDMTMHALSLRLAKNQHYNTQLLNRPHSGRCCYGKTPMQTFR